MSQQQVCQVQQAPANPGDLFSPVVWFDTGDQGAIDWDGLVGTLLFDASVDFFVEQLGPGGAWIIVNGDGAGQTVAPDTITLAVVRFTGRRIRGRLVTRTTVPTAWHVDGRYVLNVGDS